MHIGGIQVEFDTRQAPLEQQRSLYHIYISSKRYDEV